MSMRVPMPDGWQNAIYLNSPKTVGFPVRQSHEHDTWITEKIKALITKLVFEKGMNMVKKISHDIFQALKHKTVTEILLSYLT